MESRLNRGLSSSRGDRNRSGIALVLVLIVLALMTVTIVFLLMTVSSENVTSKSQASSASAKRLSDVVVQVVMAQIRDATQDQSTAANPTASAGNPCCLWASQPGMIRTYDGSGNPNNAFKLYSDSNMKVAAKSYNPASDLAAWGDWASQPALYTDLNAPSQGIYPIFDPTLADKGISMSAPGYAPPTASGNNRLVDGFYIDTSAKPLTAASNTTNPQAAMPVRWLYILKDGEVVPPDASSTGSQVTVANSAQVQPGTTYTVNGATFTNEIIGRIAFWTDDETCKLNVNTASEGTYWDTPTYCEGQDVAFGFFQPAAYEYARYPGHPATTCLTPALWHYLGLPDPLSSLAATITSDASYSFGPNSSAALSGPTGTLSLSGETSAFPTLLGTAATAGLVPRSLWGGSKAGSVSTLTSGTYSGLAFSNIRHDRLYANIDEFLFSPIYSGGTRTTNAANMQAADVARLRFILTANSRAPDTNPFGLPKVSIWPSPAKASSDPANATWTAGSTPSAEEQLLALCSTLQNYAYYFDRHDPTSTTNDVSARNQLVYNYLRNLMDKPVPGFGTSFTASKWSALQADQVLTEIYDYIRSCLNLVDSSNNTGSGAYTFPYSYTTPPSQATNKVSSALAPGTGQVVPISITNPDGNVTKGLGRFPTLRAATVMFIARAANQPPLVVDQNSRPAIYDLASATAGTAPSTYVDGTGRLSSAGLLLVLTNGAYAAVNNLHPWTNAPFRNGVPAQFVPQLMISGHPVLAYDSTYAFTGTSSDASHLYPVFDLSNGYTNQLPTYTYPTLNGSSYYLTAAGATPVPKTIKIGAITYTYYPAKIDSAPGASNYASTSYVDEPNGALGKTHAGMPFLTIQRDFGNDSVGSLEGAFDIPNPNYVDTSVNPAASMAPGTTSVEAILLPELANPAPGNVPYSANFKLYINNLNNFSANGTSLGFAGGATETIQIGTGGSSPGNYNGLFSNLSYSPTVSNRYTKGKGSSSLSPFPFYSSPVRLTGGATFAFTGSTLDVKFQTAAGAAIQELNVNFPSETFPVPKLTPWWQVSTNLDYPPQYDVQLVPAWMNTFDLSDAKLGPSGGNKLSRLTVGNGLRQQYHFLPPEMNQPGMYTQTCDTLRSVELKYGDVRLIAALPFVPSTFFTENPLYHDYSTHKLTVNGTSFTTYMRAAHSIYLNDCPQMGSQLKGLTDNLVPTLSNYSYIVDTGTTLCSLTTLAPTPALTYPSGGTINNVMPMEFAAYNAVPPVQFPSGAFGYDSTGPYVTYPFTTPTVDFTDNTFRNTVWANGGDFDNGQGLYADGPFIGKVDEGDGQNNYYNNTITALYGVTGASLYSPNRQAVSPIIFGSLPVGFGKAGGSLSSPSPSLLNDSWQTLLFCPNPNASTSSARNTRTAAIGIPEPNSLPTAGALPDYALLDFFYMPIVEPYAISSAYATAGKVNMNYEIVPYTYINRDTALRGVLKSVMLSAVDDQWIVDYKYRATNSDNPAGYNRAITNGITPANIPAKTAWQSFGNATNWQTFRYNIDADDTLKQFQQRFANLDIFRSPSEICSLWLYPTIPSGTPNPQAAQPVWDINAANIKSWWYDNPGTTRKSLTGDNLRERPYNDIYPRLTTRSNTYTVHYRVQLLKKSSTTPVTTWVEPNAAGNTGAQDAILGEYRGSSLIERYIDPNDTTLIDFTGTNPAHNLDYYYKFRVVSSREFAP